MKAGTGNYLMIPRWGGLSCGCLSLDIFPRFFVKGTFAACRTKIVRLSIIFSAEVRRGNFNGHAADGVDGFGWWLVIAGGRVVSVRREHIETTFC